MHGLLSPRELEVIEAIADGFTDKQIAARLGISERTVSGYAGRILLKYSVPSRAAAVAAWLRNSSRGGNPVPDSGTQSTGHPRSHSGSVVAGGRRRPVRQPKQTTR